MSYKVNSIGDEKVIVETDSGAYQLSAKTWSDLEPLLAGQDVDALLSVVSSVKASDVKEYDAEKAERARIRAEKQAAIEEFEGLLSEYNWSTNVLALADAVVVLRDEVKSLESAPILIDTSTLEETTGYALPGQFSFRSVSRNNERFWVIEIAPTGIPLIEKRNSLETSLAALRVSCSDEVGQLVPTILSEDLKVNSFDVDEEGIIVFDWKVKIKRKGGGGRRPKGHYEYEGEIYPSLTALGESVNGDVKYPHKTGAMLVDKGEATFVPATEES